MAMCPGVTDTTLISEAPRRLLREEWVDEFKRETDKLPKQKWVLVIKDLPFLHSSYTRDFTRCYGCKPLQLCLYAENDFRFLRVRVFKNTFPTWLNKSNKSKFCEELWAVNCAELYGHDIILLTILRFAKSPGRIQLKSQLKWVEFWSKFYVRSHIRIHK